MVVKTDIAEWIRREHRSIRELSDALLGEVRLIPRFNRDGWLDALRHRFSRFRVHLQNHFEAEEDGGFLEPVVECRPTLSPEVEHLRREHSEMSRWLDQILDELRSVGPDDELLLEDACHRIERLLSALKHHEDHENLLVTFVFSQDMGEKD